jgi:hypothetical protein
MDKWMYKIVKEDVQGFMSRAIDYESLESNLNQLGREGWEIVSCFTTEANGFTREAVAILKKKDI